MGQNCSKPEGYDGNQDDYMMKSKGVGTSDPQDTNRMSNLTFNGNQGKKSWFIIDSKNLKTSDPMYQSRRKFKPPKQLIGDRSISPIAFTRENGFTKPKNVKVNNVDADTSMVGRTVKPLNHTINRLKMANASHQVNERDLSPVSQRDNSFMKSSLNSTPGGFRRRSAKRVSFYRPGDNDDSLL